MTSHISPREFARLSPAGGALHFFFFPTYKIPARPRASQTLTPIKKYWSNPTYMSCEIQTIITTSSTSYPNNTRVMGSPMRISWESPKTSVPSPNKWIKRKAAFLSPLPLSVLWTLVSDESLSCAYSAGSHAMLSDRSLPRGSHRKSQLPGHREEK